MTIPEIGIFHNISTTGNISPITNLHPNMLKVMLDQQGWTVLGNPTYVIQEGIGSVQNHILAPTTYLPMLCEDHNFRWGLVQKQALDWSLASLFLCLLIPSLPWDQTHHNFLQVPTLFVLFPLLSLMYWICSQIVLNRQLTNHGSKEEGLVSSSKGSASFDDDEARWMMASLTICCRYLQVRNDNNNNQNIYIYIYYTYYIYIIH